MVQTPNSSDILTNTFLTETSCAAELYVTAVPASRAPAAAQAAGVCAGIHAALQAHDAWVMEERVFATSNALELICAARTRSYLPRAGGVRPLRIEIDPGTTGEIAGLQVHALCGVPKPEELCLDDLPTGRLIRIKDCGFLTLSAISSPEAGPPRAQAFRSFEKAEMLLKRAGGDFFSIARTWWWLKDICSWYGDFNQARSEFYSQRGLVGKAGRRHRLPASTGIGMRPANGAACALDVVAILARQDPTRCFDGAGNQQSAFNYGSAFSRVSRTATPGGETAFVSGTAAINNKGQSCHIGNAAAQIDDTVANVRAVLSDMQCRDAQVVQAIAYCKTPEVAQVWRAKQATVPWPVLTVLADVCRDELLFELEAAACPGARRANS